MLIWARVLCMVPLHFNLNEQYPKTEQEEGGAVKKISALEE